MDLDKPVLRQNAKVKSWIFFAALAKDLEEREELTKEIIYREYLEEIETAQNLLSWKISMSTPVSPASKFFLN